MVGLAPDRIMDRFHGPKHPDLQGAPKICGISVQQLILQEPMLLPQGANLRIDLGEKVQQPPLGIENVGDQKTIKDQTDTAFKLMNQSAGVGGASASSFFRLFVESKVRLAIVGADRSLKPTQLSRRILNIRRTCNDNLL